ncbi:MAG: hypothetical protein KIS63_23305 [Caldilineales bacterium]|nr:hypothetical protein [Caldilineales bacterium]
MSDQSSRFNRLLTMFFALLLAIQVVYLVVGYVSIPMYFHRVTTQTVEPVVYNGQVQYSNELVAQMAAVRGLSLSQYAAYRNIINGLMGLAPLVVAALIIWRARWQWFAWYTAFIIVFLGEYVLAEQTQIAGYMSLTLFGANALYWFLVLLFFFLFPNGKAVPRRAAWVVGALVIYHAFVQVGTVFAYVAPDLATQLNLPNWGTPAFIWPVMLNFLVILACQVYRYRRVSTPIERQQTKWFVFALALIIAVSFVSAFLDATGRDGFLHDISYLLLWLPLFIALAIGILRYRLWDIDIIIRKTLQYTVITALLTIIYFGSVFLLQRLFSNFTGQQSPLVLVVSTLLIAALFAPLRRRIQDGIDRRFYRKKYDARQVVAQFARTARDETDMNALLAELERTIQDTLQPEGVRVWMRKE